MSEMQVDHIKPVIDGGKNNLSNLHPSCRTCNHYKRDCDVKSFKSWLLDGIVNRLQNLYIFKVAVRYGMVTIHEWDHKFYFEKCEHYCGECKNYYSYTITKIDGTKETIEECRREFEEVRPCTALQQSCDSFK